jgi:two-component system OmpR family sensor kinase
VTSLLVGSPVTGVPDVREAVNATGGAPGLVTVRSVDGNARFRAFVVHQSGSGDVVVAASPLNGVEDSVSRLVRTLWITGGVTAGVLGIAFFWIQHLGLRPIARVTSIAEAIAQGDRSQRVPMTDGRTEAGKLGLAFNVMLDERDAGEKRLRQFVADASHELRTPLTSVRGYLELFRQGAFRKPEQLDDVVRRLSAEATRMHELVDDLLVLASLDEGRPLRIDEVDVGQLVRDAAQDAQATQPGRHFEVAVPEETPTVHGDEALLVQLVGILVANALTHTPATAPVELSVIPGETDVTVVVADGGPGLEAELAERVFDRFWRGELSRTRSASNSRSGSTGLGLAIARSITDSHGGSIALDTAPGEGCTFTIRIPRHPELADYS